MPIAIMAALLLLAAVLSAPTATAFSPATPAISSFSPGSGSIGTSVTITGTGFASVTAVKFNGASASYSVASATTIKATVPNTATTGPISVTAGGTTSTSTTSFTVTLGAVISPAVGPPTSKITLHGSGFAANEAVDVYGQSTALALVVSDGTGAVSSTVTVPASAQPGDYWITLIGRRSGLATQVDFGVHSNVAQYGSTSTRSFANRFENTVTPSTVRGLDVRSTIPAVDGSESVSKGTLYYLKTTTVAAAVTIATGAPKWTVALPCASSTAPAITAYLYVGCTNGMVIALNPNTGAIVWTYVQSDSTTTMVGPLAVTGSGVVGILSSGAVFSLSSTGSLMWSVTPSPADAFVAASGSTVVVTDTSGFAAALEAATGAVRWSSGAGGIGIPVIAGGEVYEVARGGQIFCRDLQNGYTDWSTATGLAFYTPAALSGGVLYVVDTQDTVHAYSTDNGVPLWTSTAARYIDTPFVAGGLVWVNDIASKVVALSATTGTVEGSVGGLAYRSPLVADGVVFADASNFLSEYSLPTATDDARPDPAALRR